MNIKIMLLLLIAILPLSAQTWEVGIFAGDQSYRSTTNEPTGLGYESFGLKTKANTVEALRVGYSIIDSWPTKLQITVASQPKTSTTQSSSLYLDNPSGDNSQSYRYQSSFSAIGLMANFKLLGTVGLGLDYRFEHLSAQHIDTSINRPWVRANAGMAFPCSIVKPFISIELAMPLGYKHLNSYLMNENAIQAAAPIFQLGIYTGVRF